ncbi:PIR Superfamily Protein [Plasmodium ovale wallikeri]|uniref:PIR Superfamily Protein n=1 Tax=Plasmodium ovale wallikeri TaxID=864142 RepID=A0A1A9ANL5_PLAOA|nr:PIR Superfamily Protein [Plasmodium ovale wallikeri]SBT59174.1 PIR Superfamily Protein [Plasmodium ovale wallikeri]
MSSQVKSTDFYKLFSNSSKELFSEKFYEAANNDSSDLSKYDNECNDIHVHNPKVEMIKIYKKYLRYLEYCKLLHNDNSLHKVSFKWTNFDYRRRNEPYYLKCKPNFELVNHNDWDKRKKLYDYYVDYDILFGLAKNIDDKCDYYKKIEEKKPLYEYFEKECPPPKNNCPDFYNKCMPYKPDNVLSKLPCHEKIAQEQADAKVAERPHAMQHESRSAQDTEVGPPGSGVPGLASGSKTEYTPIGSWIRNLGKNSTNSISDMDREMERFFGDTQESGDILLGETSNYISYQPM